MSYVFKILTFNLPKCTLYVKMAFKTQACVLTASIS